MRNSAAQRECRISQESLSSIINLCDSWLDERAAEFDPFSWENPDLRFTRRKAFAEASLYLYVNSSVGSKGQLPSLEEAVQKWVLNERYSELVRRHPRHITLYSSGALFAKASGILDERLDSAVKHSLSLSAAWSFERVPHRILDIWHFCNAYGFDNHDIAPEDAIRLSCLAHPPDAAYANLSDAYALTHVILFCNNFGVPSSRFTPSLTQKYKVGSSIEALILRFMHEENTDIVFELLLCLLLQGELNEDICILVYEWLIEKINHYGFVPGPYVKASLGSGFDHWSENYHTVMVVGTCTRLLLENLSSIKLSIDDIEKEVAYTLGHSIATMANYELPIAAALLEKVGNRNERFKLIIQNARQFLLHQENAKWGFGYWTDEKVIYEQKNPGFSFEFEFTQPLKSVCAQALEATK